MQRLPQELARILQANQDQIGLLKQDGHLEVAAWRSTHDYLVEPGEVIRRPRTDGHVGGLGHQEVIKIPESRTMFEARQIGVGCFCATRASGPGLSGEATKQLENSKVWIWKVLYMYQPGDLLPGNPSKLKSTHTHVYEAQLYAPADLGDSLHGPLEAIWQVQNTRRFVLTDCEKKDVGFRANTHNIGKGGGSSIRAPMTVFLRPCNIIGGGFSLDDHDIVPRRIRSYIDSIMSDHPMP